MKVEYIPEQFVYRITFDEVFYVKADISTKALERVVKEHLTQIAKLVSNEHTELLNTHKKLLSKLYGGPSELPPYFFGTQPSPSLKSGGDTVFDALAKVLPETFLTKEAACPVCNLVQPVPKTVIHLNDKHYVPREVIAQWLKESGNNFEFVTKEKSNESD